MLLSCSFFEVLDPLLRGALQTCRELIYKGAHSRLYRAGSLFQTLYNANAWNRLPRMPPSLVRYFHKQIVKPVPSPSCLPRMPLEKCTLFLSLYAEGRYIQLSASCFLYKINHHSQEPVIQQSYLIFLSNIWVSHRLPTRFLSMILRNPIRKKLINQGKNLKSSITLVFLGFILERDNAIN